MDPISLLGGPGSLRGLARSILFLILAVIAGFVAIQVWPAFFGHSTNEYHVPLLSSLRGQMGHPGDEVARYIGRYAAPMWWGLSWLPIGTQALFDGGYLLSRILFAGGVGLLVAVVSGRRLRIVHFVVGAALSLATLWYRSLPGGGDPVLGQVFSQTSVSIGILALALAAGLKEKHLLSGALLGMAMNVNPMQAFLSSGILVLLWTGTVRSPSQAARRILPALGIALVVGTPSIVLVFGSLFSDPVGEQLQGEKLADFARFFLSGHFFLFSKEPLVVVESIVLTIIPLLLGLLLGLSRRQMAAFTLPPLVAIAVQSILVEIHPTRFLFQLHLLRMDVFSILLAVVLAVGLVLRGGRSRIAEISIGSACLIHLASGAFLASAITAVIGLMTKFGANRAGVKPALLVVVLALAIYAGIRGQELALVGYLLLVPAILPERIQKTSVTAVLRGVAVGGVVLASISSYKLHWESETKRFIQRNDRKVAAVLKAAGDTLPTSALVVVPPMVNARAYLGSRVWFNFYEGAAFLWAPGSGSETLRRLAVLGMPYDPSHQFDLSELNLLWQSGHCSRIPRLRKEGVTHILIAKDSLQSDGTFGWKVVGLSEAYHHFCGETDTGLAQR